MPIYVVTLTAGEEKVRRLVEAKNQAQALSHVVEGSVTVKRAEQAELVELTKAGVEVEKPQ